MNLFSGFYRELFLFFGFIFFFHCAGAGSFDELEKVGLSKEVPQTDLPSSPISPPTLRSFDCTGFTPFESCESLKKIYLDNSETFEKNKNRHNWFQLEKNLCFWVGINCDSQQRIIGLSISSYKVGIQLTTIPSLSFAGLPYLQQIKIEGHSISQINADTFMKFRYLNSLILTDNQIKELAPYAFWNNPQLKEIYLNDNKIEEVNATTFASLSDMEDLRLFNNEIRVIEAGSFSDLSKIKIFNLSHNKIEEITPDTFKGLLIVSFIDLSYNNIKKIKAKSFANSLRLTMLDLSHNQIEKITVENFADTPNLEHLSLSSNQINEISFAGFSKLHTLYLSQNQIAGNIPLNVFYSCTSWPGRVCTPHLPALTTLVIDDKLILPQPMCDNKNLIIMPSTHACYPLYPL